MLGKNHKLQPKAETSDELKVVLQTIWVELPAQENINKTVANFTRRLTAYMAVATNNGHFEHLQ